MDGWMDGWIGGGSIDYSSGMSDPPASTSQPIQQLTQVVGSQQRRRHCRRICPSICRCGGGCHAAAAAAGVSATSVKSGRSWDDFTRDRGWWDLTRSRSRSIGGAGPHDGWQPRPTPGWCSRGRDMGKGAVNRSIRACMCVCVATTSRRGRRRRRREMDTYVCTLSFKGGRRWIPNSKYELVDERL